MRKFILVTIVGLALLNDGLCLAQTLQPPVVAVLEFKEAMDQSDYAKKQMALYNAKLDFYKDAIAKKQQYVNDLFTKLQDLKNTTVTKELYEKELRDAQRFTEDSNVELAQLKEKLTVDVNAYVSDAIKAYLLKNKIDIILPSTSVATCVSKYNVTSSFLMYINKEYKK
jgi:Skp family chaperone for outer membrane proteins